jgi:endonuclease/exonuclease/phosphatase family metal-dependent hydrolase
MGVCGGQLVTVAMVLALGATLASAAAPPIKVMTYNIRGDFDEGKVTDSPEAWRARSGNHRRDLVTQLIQRESPDLLGVQEAYHNQVVDLEHALPGFAQYGVGREDGRDRGEHCTIFYCTNRFTPREQGTFWLSEEPDTTGSKFSDAACTRIATWLILDDKLAGDTECFVLNTHWDHVSQAARLHSAKLIRERLPSLAGDRPVIVMGDMNADEDNPAIAVLLNADGSTRPRLSDGYRTVVPERDPDEATFHAFRGTSAGQRIDYILSSEHFRPIEAAIIRTDFEGRYPSDHFPVVVVLQPTDSSR